MEKNITLKEYKGLKKEAVDFIYSLNDLPFKVDVSKLDEVVKACESFSFNIALILQNMDDFNLRILKHDIINRIGFLSTSASALSFNAEMEDDFYNEDVIFILNKEINLIKNTILDQISSLSVFKKNINSSFYNVEDLNSKLNIYKKLAEKHNLEMNIINNIPTDRVFFTHFGILFNLIYNIIENAHKHGGNVSEIEFEVFEDESGVKILISDNGDGIQIEDKDSIFEYGITDGNGTGIGLGMAKEHMQLFGGNLELAENSKFGGADFLISLPFEKKDK